MKAKTLLKISIGINVVFLLAIIGLFIFTQHQQKRSDELLIRAVQSEAIAEDWRQEAAQHRQLAEQASIRASIESQKALANQFYARYQAEQAAKESSNKSTE